jgi:hypothetical protein
MKRLRLFAENILAPISVTRQTLNAKDTSILPNIGPVVNVLAISHTKAKNAIGLGIDRFKRWRKKKTRFPVELIISFFVFSSTLFS